MTEPKKVTDKLDQTQLEQALEKSLASGVSAINQQIRYILALSQLNAAEPESAPYQPPAVSVAEARLSTLTQLSSVLDATKITQLFRDVRQITDEALRLRLMLLLLPDVPVERRTRFAQEIWDQINALEDPLTRSQLLFHMVPLMTSGLNETALVAVTLSNAIKLAQSIENVEARLRSLVALAPHLPPAMELSLFNHILDEVDDVSSDNLRANAINAMVDHLPKAAEQRTFQSVQNIFNPYERIRALTALARITTSSMQSAVREAALKAIVQIRNEDDRAEALINFAPHLEPATEEDGFPEILEQALGVAVTLTRRQMRARTLVALAPHLTLDLQGEALAAVHSLSNERDRSILLAELAPTLPPNMLVASLAVAHTMREQDSRVHALTVLAHYAPEHAREQTVLDALAAASNLPHHYERVTALVALVDVLPSHLLDQAFTNALETTRLIENESARARALSLLGHHLPVNLLERALDAAYHIEDLQMRLSALTGIVPRIPIDERTEPLKRMLETARQMPFDYKRSRAMVSIAPNLTPELIDEGLKLAEELEDPFDQVSAYIALAQNMPPTRRPDVINAAWALIKKIEDGYDRSSALAAIATFIPEEMDHEIANHAGDVIRVIHEDYDKASAISILAPVLARGEAMTADSRLDRFSVIRAAFHATLEIPQQTLRSQQLTSAGHLWETLEEEERYNLWQELAIKLSKMPLTDTLMCLGYLLPAIRSLTDDNIRIKEIAHILGLR